MEITRKLLKELRPQIDEALLPLATKYGMKIETGTGMYGGLTGHFKLVLETEGENGETKYTEAWNANYSYFGMNKEWLGQVLTNSRNQPEYEITGLAPKKRKFPITVTSIVDGKDLLMTVSGVRRIMLRMGHPIPEYFDDNLAESSLNKENQRLSQLKNGGKEAILS